MVLKRTTDSSSLPTHPPRTPPREPLPLASLPGEGGRLGPPSRCVTHLGLLLASVSPLQQLVASPCESKPSRVWPLEMLLALGVGAAAKCDRESPRCTALGVPACVIAPDPPLLSSPLLPARHWAPSAPRGPLPGWGHCPRPPPWCGFQSPRRFRPTWMIVTGGTAVPTAVLTWPTTTTSSPR